jgi:phenylalanyl-tRNA synthetase alpha chain
MTHKEIVIDSPEEQKLAHELKKRTDADALRELRFLSMPDLSRTSGHPLAEIVGRTLHTRGLADFDIIKIPEIVPAHVTFDLFNMPPGHSARSRSDTHYVSDTHILRTHDTVFWYYYLNLPEIQKKMKGGDSFGALCFGKVYRKDELDRNHMNVFHQMGGLYLVPDGKRAITLEDLKAIITDIVKEIFGSEAEIRFNPDTFPYTDPSLETEIKVGGRWVEILGGGLPRKSVLANFGVSGYNGWAFGFGLERLAIVSMNLPDIRLLWSRDERITRQLKLGQRYKEVSKYPPIVRDISFVADKSFVPNDYFNVIEDIGGALVEEVKLLDKYEDAKKFGEGKLSYTYRIVYRSLERTLTNEEVNAMHQKVEEQTIKEFGATVR